MRRVLSIFLILFFGIGPFAAALKPDDDSGLPACCRRHGAHHCDGPPGMAKMIVLPAGESSVSAPSTCPYFPGYTVATSTASLAVAEEAHGSPVLLVLRHLPAIRREAERFGKPQTRADRGPPVVSRA